MLYEHRSQRYTDGNLNSDGTEFHFDEASTATRQTISVDAKYEKRRVTFACLLSRVSAELSFEVNIDINVFTCSSMFEIHVAKKNNLFCFVFRQCWFFL